MKILIRPVEPGLKRLIGWGEGTEALPDGSDGLVGYLRREPSGRWMIVDHIAGHDVDYSDLGYRDAVLTARQYFAPRGFCDQGCGHLTAADTCATCAGARV